VYVAFLSGFILGMLLGVALMALFSSGRRTRIPFAPALSGGAVIAVFWGSQIAHAFFGRTG
jgi:leader peptidase (prepilin peptidase)/N-methyltransferase